MIFKLLKCNIFLSECVKCPVLAAEKLFVIWFERCSISFTMDIRKFYIMS